MSDNAEGPPPRAQSDPDAPEAGHAPKPPPDSSWLKTEEVRGTGRERLPLPLEPRRRRRTPDTGRPE